MTLTATSQSIISRNQSFWKYSISSRRSTIVLSLKQGILRTVSSCSQYFVLTFYPWVFHKMTPVFLDWITLYWPLLGQQKLMDSVFLHQNFSLGRVERA